MHEALPFYLPQPIFSGSPDFTQSDEDRGYEVRVHVPMHAHGTRAGCKAVCAADTEEDA